jgi:inhibitor of KinA sporulation pathway (predicted exonuclease)
LTIRKDKIIIVDLESTCWEGYDAPPGQENEIIEIGICMVDVATYEITGKRAIFVKPTRSIISPFCTELTTITPELVEKEGISFYEACDILEHDYDSRNRLWGSWGNYDHKMFAAQCKSFQVRYPFSDKYANLKRAYGDLKGKRIGLNAALEALKMEREGIAHRGDDDAYNTARVLVNLMQTHGIVFMKPFGL